MLKRKANINKKLPNKLRTFWHFFIKKLKDILLLYRLKFNCEINLKRNKNKRKLPVF